MTGLIPVPRASQWQRLKALVLDSVSSPITKRVYNLGLDGFFAWYSPEPRAGLRRQRSRPGVLRSKLAGWAPFPLTCGSQPSGNWLSKLRTTACWRPNWPAGSRA